MSLQTELINSYLGKATNVSSLRAEPLGSEPKGRRPQGEALTGLKGQYEISLIWQLRSSGMFMDCPYKERISPNPKGIPARPSRSDGSFARPHDSFIPVAYGRAGAGRKAGRGGM
ncbi:MAG: hypothetical protein AABZ02_01215 [Bacteroidota bacterium]